MSKAILQVSTVLCQDYKSAKLQGISHRETFQIKLLKELYPNKILLEGPLLKM